MPSPKIETRATARPGINRSSTSPSSAPGSPPQTRSRANENLSPLRRGGRDQSQDELSSGEEDLDNNQGNDEIDCSIPRNSPRLYPDLSFSPDSAPKPGLSPATKKSLGSPEDSFVSSLSQCAPRRTTAATARKGPRAEIPLTPEKGSPGRKIYPNLEDRKSTRGMTPIMSIAFVMLLFGGLLTLYQSLQNVEEFSNTKPYAKSIQEIYKDIKSELRVVNMEFSQSKHFWVQLLGQLDTIMTDYPIQPAVILSVVPEGAEATAVCLLHKVSQAVSNGFQDDGFVMYDVKSEMHKGHQHLKRDLYNSLSKLQDSHAAIVHNIEAIPGTAAMTFHAFCDNENAPFKQAIIILVVTIQGKYEDLSWERLANTIDDYLKGKWGEELMEKDVAAVVSRVANAPVLIKPESSSTLDLVCQNL